MGSRMSSVSPHQIDIIQAALAARGYNSGILSAFRSVQLPAGSTFAIQFADEIAVEPKSLPKVILNGKCQINADEGPSVGVICLGVEKAHRIRGARPFELVLKLKLQIGIEADFHVPAELARGGSSIQRLESYVHLQTLLADASDTLRSFRIAPLDNALCGPAIRIEARFFNDIALGRTGVTRSCNATVSADYVRYASAACEWLQHRVFPELRSVIRDLTREHRFIDQDRQAPAHNQAPTPLSFLDANGTSQECKTVQ